MFMGQLVESELHIYGYGTIQYGTMKNSRESRNVIEMIDSLIFVPLIEIGGSPDLPKTNCELIWDGKYITNLDGDIGATLVFSYVNPGKESTIGYRTLQFDLSPLKHPDVKRIKVRILGYIHELYYTY